MARRPAPLRLWLARLGLAVGAPAALLAFLELGLRLGGYGHPTTFLIPDDRPGFVRSNPEYASLFLPGNFDLRPLNFRLAVHKAPNTVRIVVLGESAAQGVPVPSFAFAPQVRAQLRARYPRREFEVINTGIVAINSHVVYQIAAEMADYEPDLFLVYVGNNEVVGPYGPGCAYLAQMPPLWVIRASVRVRATRSGQLLAALVGRLTGSAGRRREWGGMSMFVDQAVAGDDPRLAGVYRNFEANLRGIVAAAARAHAKAVLCTPVGNLKDCAPFLSRHRSGLRPEELAAWQGDFDAGRVAWLLGEDREAARRLAAAAAVDPQYADVLFLQGAVELRSGEAAAARAHLLAALHWDALRFRPDTPIAETVRRVARAEPQTAILLDTALALGSDPASAGIPSGRELLFEHVHFDWPGSFRIGRLMAEASARALYGDAPGGAAWLDADGAAAALGYTAHERLPMLLRIDVLERKPPFTNQLTYVQDEAAMARDLTAATAQNHDPAVLGAAAAATAAAVSSDGDNPALAGLLAGIRADQGDLVGALALARRAAELLPPDFALAADQSSLLVRLGRFPEAEAILRRGAASWADLDLLAPVYAELWTKTGRWEDGRKFLDEAIARRPGDRRLMLVRANLRHAAGDRAGAELELRHILDLDPASDEALESLVALLVEAGRTAEVGPLSLARATGQPRNQANNLRASRAAEARGDAEGALGFLLAAERSGPVTATFELTVALTYYQQRRFPELMLHLAEARRLAPAEGDPQVTASIDGLVARLRREEAGSK